jgi:tetratricopeptide (TPR) repeat protein
MFRKIKQRVVGLFEFAKSRQRANGQNYCILIADMAYNQPKDKHMDEKALHKLITRGENEIVDFKRELKLETADEKAEFIKDLISLANSATDKGYLIIGIDNKSDSIGIERLEEERIQQITHAYIYPNIVLVCHSILLDSKLIGVLEVHPTEKPHQVIKNIGRLAMHDVFIRHGSIVEQASPSEQARMREKEPTIQREIRQLSQAAEKHLKIGNIEQAIKAYTKAIELMPTVELLLARARTYKYFFRAAETYCNGFVDTERAEPAAKDFSDALVLADSDEIERQIRLERLELFSMSGGAFRDNIWNQEFSWALENTQDEDYGQLCFLLPDEYILPLTKVALKT